MFKITTKDEGTCGLVVAELESLGVVWQNPKSFLKSFLL
jgi:hypothetical protein